MYTNWLQHTYKITHISIAINFRLFSLFLGKQTDYAVLYGTNVDTLGQSKAKIWIIFVGIAP